MRVFVSGKETRGAAPGLELRSGAKGQEAQFFRVPVSASDKRSRRGPTRMPAHHDSVFVLESGDEFGACPERHRVQRGGCRQAPQKEPGLSPCARSASRVSETTVEAPAFMPGKIGKKNAGLQPRRPCSQTAERKSFGRCSMLTHQNSVFAFVSGHD